MALAILFVLFTCTSVCENVLAVAEETTSSDIDRLNTVVANLATQNARTLDMIEELIKTSKAQDQKHSQKLSKLEQEIEVMGQKQSKLEMENEQLRTMLEAQHTNVRSVSRNDRLLLFNQEPSVGYVTKPAFSAKMSRHLTSIGNQQTLIFDTVDTNVGNAYSPVSGIFTAPVNGTYFFLASIVSHSGEYLETEIVINGHSRAYMYCNSPSQDQGTNGIVATLKENDLVWVRHLSTAGNNVYGYNWTTFTGFMI